LKYSDYLASTLVSLGYTKCFSVGGGNIMHLVESLSKSMAVIPVLHEHTACIAAEHFNELTTNEKALVLVTTGPGLTNCVTSIASCYLESRELLVIGGQVKSSDLSRDGQRQIGIQELQGTEIVAPISKKSIRITHPLNDNEFNEIASQSWTGRKGPVFIEIPLDVQAAEVAFSESKFHPRENHRKLATASDVGAVGELISNSSRPVILLGGGLNYSTAVELASSLEKLDVPIMTSWNGADRFDHHSSSFFGRPNTWGQRYSNVIVQQADLLVSIGARLGLQQTGFNWQEFAPLAKIVQVDIDPLELSKGRPNIYLPINADAGDFLERLIAYLYELKFNNRQEINSWNEFCLQVKALLPTSEETNSEHDGFWNPYDFYIELSDSLSETDVLLPCSSGSSFTSAYQAIQIRLGTRVVSSKSLASMGYGLGAAVGAAYVEGKRPVLVEGDGGFAQNLQDIGTLFKAQPLSKIFIWSNGGYASIRKTQQTYFGGHYVGCDLETGLVLPDWVKLFDSFGVRCQILRPGESIGDALLSDTQAFVVPIHPDQTYFPKIASRVVLDGRMQSEPIHSMHPPLDPKLSKLVFQYIQPPVLQ
jgi:acetolactate synthase-1/2/3 large subunit